MGGGVIICRGELDVLWERFGDVGRQLLGPDDLGPEQRVDLEVSLREVTGDLERLCRYLEPCGQGNPGPVFGIRGVRFTSRSVVGNGHLKGALGDEPVDAAFRIECDEWNGMRGLQARLCALTPHVANDAT